MTDVTLVAPNTHSTVENIDHHEDFACNSDGTLLALSVVPAWAKSDNGNGNGQVKGAPGPLVGAGLPVLLVGGGIYWIVRRRKKAS